jgi:hypothetical protein
MAFYEQPVEEKERMELPVPTLYAEIKF